MADDSLEDWIIRGDLKKERRSRIVPASTERLDSEDPGDGESAMNAIASWLSTEPDLPLIEFARLTPRVITLSFADDVILPDPFQSETGDPETPHDQWGITHQHAMNLPQGEAYGWQTAGLTGLGTLVDGSRALVNTCRWEILQIAGTPEWTRNIMITQVMSQATEPWSVDHDIWLIGFEETAEKLASFLVNQQPRHRFHIADTLTEISALDLKNTSATLYVMGTGPETQAQFKALQVAGIGMITDSVVTDEAMFLTERDGSVAVLGPFEKKLEVWPNLQVDLIKKMEKTWEVNEEVARQQAAAADFTQLLEPEQDHQTEPEKKTPEQIKADFESLLAETDFDTDPAAEIEEPSQSTPDHDSEESTVETGTTTDDTSTETEEAVAAPTTEYPKESSETQPVDDEEPQIASAPEADISRDAPMVSTAEAAEPEKEADPLPSQEPEGKTEGPTEASVIRLSLLGEPRAHTPEGELTGRHAAALVILEMTSETVPAQQISEALWPNDEPTGHNARTRRTRLLEKLREHVGDIITIGDQGWSITSGHITTDYDEVLDTLDNDPADHEQSIIEACTRIARPLADSGQWADYYRELMTQTLTDKLNDMKTRAIDAEAFDIAKAAKTARTTLGEE